MYKERNLDKKLFSFLMPLKGTVSSKRHNNIMWSHLISKIKLTNWSSCILDPRLLIFDPRYWILDSYFQGH